MNTLKRKLTAILLTFAMLFSLMPALPQVAEAVEMSSKYVELLMNKNPSSDEAKSITVNVYVDNAESPNQIIRVDDASPAYNKVQLTVLGEYEIAGDDAVTTAGETGLISVTGEKVSADFKSWSCRYSGNNGLIINVNLRSPLAHPDMPGGYYDGDTQLNFER